MAPNNSIAARAYLDISYLSFGFHGSDIKGERAVVAPFCRKSAASFGDRSKARRQIFFSMCMKRGWIHRLAKAVSRDTRRIRDLDLMHLTDRIRSGRSNRLREISDRRAPGQIRGSRICPGERHESKDDCFGFRGVRRCCSHHFRFRRQPGRRERQRPGRRASEPMGDGRQVAEGETRAQVRAELVQAENDGQLAALDKLYRGG
ncbi:DUF4148 domain-containing protein [Burkholderia contaminans]|uniref:DUF4148 domain-containing protein n=1 Tax=Burkholderia contaminans TaxID=488447 RepID=UPI002D800C2F|nr:DUF4148 domain-containing protein [Burkholderia contaminans]